MLATLTSARAGVAHIGRGLAEAQGLAPKHAIKQVDRLFRDELLSVEELAPYWLEFVAGNRTKLVVSLDWTAFATCDHRTLVLSVIARDKRATPVLWKTVQRSGIQRIAVEDELLERLHAALPLPIRITLFADRGFASCAMYLFLRALVSAVKMESAQRRDRLLLINVLAQTLVYLPPGIDRFRPPPKKWGAWGELNFCG